MTRQKRERKGVYLLKQKVVAVHLLRQSLFQQLNSHLKKEKIAYPRKDWHRGVLTKNLFSFPFGKKMARRKIWVHHVESNFKPSIARPVALPIQLQRVHW